MAEKSAENLRISEERKMEEATSSSGSPENDAAVEQPETGVKENDAVDWNDDPHNPLNWPTWKKMLQVTTLSSTGLLASVPPPQT